MVSMAITVPLGLATRVLMPRFLGPEQLGQLQFAETFPNIALGFMTLGVSTYIQKSIPPRPEHAKDVLTPLANLLRAVGALLASLVLAYLFVGDYDSHMLVLCAITSAVIVLTTIQNDVVQKIFFSIGQAKTVAFNNTLCKGLANILVIVALWAGAGSIGVALGFLAAQVLGSGLMARHARRLGLTGGRLTRAEYARILRISFPFFLSGAVAANFGSIDSLLLSKLVNFTELGLLGSAQRLLGVFLILVPVIGNSVAPVMSQTFAQDPAAFRDLCEKITAYMAAACMMLAGLMTFFPKEIITVVYGAEFLPASTALVVTGALLTTTYLAIYLNSVAALATNGKKQSVANILFFFLTPALSYSFLKSLQGGSPAGAAAAATSLATLISQILNCFVMARIAGVLSWRGRVLRTIVFALALPLALIAFAGQVEEQALLVRVGAYALLLPVYILATRILTVAEARFLLQLPLSWLRRRLARR
jgi:O-antigen/teichoic acid export membrane protein